MKNSKLITSSIEVFKYHKDAAVIFATTDGHYFLESAKHFAKDHAAKHGCEVVEITREEAENAHAGADDSDDVTIKPIDKMTVPELKVFAEENAIEITKTKKVDILEEVRSGVIANQVGDSLVKAVKDSESLKIVSDESNGDESDKTADNAGDGSDEASEEE